MGIFSKIFGSKDEDNFLKIDFGEDEDLFQRSINPEYRFLNRFKKEDIHKIINKSNLADYLKENNFSDDIFKIYTDEASIHHLEIFNKKESDENLLIDLRLSLARLSPKNLIKKPLILESSFDMIVIEWLSTRNPKKSCYADNRPQLPGQKSPGLGVLKHMMTMMYLVAKDITSDGFLDVPDHLHLAVMYSKKFRFFDPEKEGFVKAIKRDLEDLSLYQIAMADVTSCIRDLKSGHIVKYDPGKQIFPISRRMERYFKTKEYKLIEKKSERKKYYVDIKELESKINKVLKKKNITEL